MLLISMEIIILCCNLSISTRRKPRNEAGCICILYLLIDFENDVLRSTQVKQKRLFKCVNCVNDPLCKESCELTHKMSRSAFQSHDQQG